MEALGANKFQAFWSACVPQILPVYLSHSLYCFEMNVRASAILGYVGAGGRRITINERIGWRDYNNLAWCRSRCSSSWWRSTSSANIFAS